MMEGDRHQSIPRWAVDMVYVDDGMDLGYRSFTLMVSDAAEEW